MDFWSAPTFATAYGLSSTIPTSVLEDCLNEAQEVIEAYTLSTAYATAVAGGVGQYTFKRVMAELALFFLDRHPLFAPKHVKSEEKEYVNIKRYKQTYIQMNGPASWSRGWILEQLIDYKAETEFVPYETWGTGRFASASLVVEEDEDVWP